MSRSTVGTLFGLAIAALAAWRIGGVVGTGLLGGFLLGASLSGFGVAWQRHLLRTRPEKAFGATVSTFLLKLAVLLSAALCLRYVEPVGRHADWRGFLVGFASAVLVVVLLGCLDALALLRERRVA